MPAKGKGTFRDYDLSFVHIDVKHLPKLQTGDGDRRKRYLFVAIDRCSRAVHLAVKDDETEQSAIAFLREAAAALPFQLTHVLTDNSSCFTPALPKLASPSARNTATSGLERRRQMAWSSASTAASPPKCSASTSTRTARSNRCCSGSTPPTTPSASACWTAKHQTKPHGRAGPCNVTKARLSADAAKEAPQPNTQRVARVCLRPHHRD